MSSVAVIMRWYSVITLVLIRENIDFFFSLVAGQNQLDLTAFKPDVTIHIGEVTGDYSAMGLIGNEVWRVSRDGELRDTFRSLRYVFEMDEQCFFENYSGISKPVELDYFKNCQTQLESLRQRVPDLPYSNIWIAQQTAHNIPEGSVVHFGILNSLRSWNFFELPGSVDSMSNVGGFGIDGGLSSLVGASLANPDKIYFGIIGDLAFFYDMNALGNRHIGSNLRIIVVNNGKGTEFRQYNSLAAHFGEEADEYISASGHFGDKSPDLIKNYAQDLNFVYLAASTKEEYEAALSEFLVDEIGAQPFVLEVFTDSEEESDALRMIQSIAKDPKEAAKTVARTLLSSRGARALKKLSDKL